MSAAAAPARRRLWQLPAIAHDLLLATSFAPDALRREAEHVLGRVHCAPCSLEGSDSDLLYSVVHDMASRNALSEAMHARLDEQHAVALQRHARLREADALREAWCAALEGDDVPGALWAVLTHRHGAQLQDRALYDARAWVFAQARRALTSGHADRWREARLAATTNELAALRERMLHQQRRAQHELQRLHAEAARLAGEVARWRSACDALRAAGAGPASPPADSAPDRSRAIEGPTPCERQPVMPFDAAAPGCGAAAAAGDAHAMRGRRVLCVGGIRRAVARYRTRVERAGGRFEHHDGGAEDGLHSLDGRLERADLVICQAGCINHQAYHRVKRFCERRGKPCLYLERPSLAHFEQALRSLEAR